jgi:Secretion system C-terminal sorting domain
MKKQLLTLVSMAVLSASSFVANAQIPNGNLESWINFQIYDDPDTNGIIKTLNVIATFPQSPPVTCFKDTNPHAGSFCARIVAAQVQSLNIFVPGVLGTVTPFFTPNIGCDLEKPYVGRPATLKAWIKYAPVAGDSAEIFAYMLKDNGGSFETLGVAKQKYLQAIGSWTEQTLNFSYSNTTDISTHMSLVFVTSKAYDFSNLTGCSGQVGSTMWIDDIEVIGYSGVSEMLFTGEEINVYPNPSESVLNISISQEISNAVLSVTDMSGREISSQNVSGNQFTLDVNSLKAGNYVVVLKENNTILGRKTFVKK